MILSWWKSVSFPTLLHITHAKAGSTWISDVLQALFKKRFQPRAYQMPDFKSSKARVFSVFMSREQFLERPELARVRRFVVIRDLRDTLISRYYSQLKTHAPDPAGKVLETRQALQGLDKVDGLRQVMNEQGMRTTAHIQQSWLGSGELLLRYEEMIVAGTAGLERLFIEQLRMPVTREEVRQAAEAHSFEKKFQRKLGEEDQSSHGRKGTPGDWRNHFTPALAREFHEAYGQTLLAAGYEADPAWYTKLS